MSERTPSPLDTENPSLAPKAAPSARMQKLEAMDRYMDNVRRDLAAAKNVTTTPVANEASAVTAAPQMDGPVVAETPVVTPPAKDFIIQPAPLREVRAVAPTRPRSSGLRRLFHGVAAAAALALPTLAAASAEAQAPAPATAGEIAPPLERAEKAGTRQKVLDHATRLMKDHQYKKDESAQITTAAGELSLQFDECVGTESGNIKPATGVTAEQAKVNAAIALRDKAKTFEDLVEPTTDIQTPPDLFLENHYKDTPFKGLSHHELGNHLREQTKAFLDAMEAMKDDTEMQTYLTTNAASLEKLKWDLQRSIGVEKTVNGEEGNYHRRHALDDKKVTSDEALYALLREYTTLFSGIDGLDDDDLNTKVLNKIDEMMKKISTSPQAQANAAKADKAKTGETKDGKAEAGKKGPADEVADGERDSGEAHDVTPKSVADQLREAQNAQIALLEEAFSQKGPLNREIGRLNALPGEKYSGISPITHGDVARLRKDADAGIDPAITAARISELSQRAQNIEKITDKEIRARLFALNRDAFIGLATALRLSGTQPGLDIHIATLKDASNKETLVTLRDVKGHYYNNPNGYATAKEFDPNLSRQELQRDAEMIARAKASLSRFTDINPRKDGAATVVTDDLKGMTFRYPDITTPESAVKTGVTPALKPRWTTITGSNERISTSTTSTTAPKPPVIVPSLAANDNALNEEEADEGDDEDETEGK